MNGRMRIVVELRDFEEAKSAYLAKKIESIPTVNSVQASRIWRGKLEP